MVDPKIQLLHPKPLDPSVPVASGPKADALVRTVPLPTARPAPGVKVRVLAGATAGVESSISTFSDIAMVHACIAPGATWHLELPPDYTCLMVRACVRACVGACVRA